MPSASWMTDFVSCFNNCMVLLNHGLYNSQHNAVLSLLFKATSKHLRDDFMIYYSDLKHSSGPSPCHLVLASQLPDTILWNVNLHKVLLVELNVCHETNFDASDEHRVTHIWVSWNVKAKGYACEQYDVLTGSRGCIHLTNLYSFFQFIIFHQRKQKELASDVISCTIKEPFRIWISRNKL